MRSVEHCDMFKTFESPKDFIKMYIKVFDMQKDTPYKVFLNDTPYYKDFHSLFIDDLFSKVNSSTNQKKIRKYFLEIENILLSMKDREFYDINFYKDCMNIYLNAVTYLIDNSESEIMEYKDKEVICSERLVDSCVNLFVFTSKNICLYNFFLRNLCTDLNASFTDIVTFFEKIKNIKKIIFEINESIRSVEMSKYKEKAELMAKINISDLLISDIRVLQHSFDTFFQELIFLIQKYLLTLPMEEAYLKSMNFTSEMVLSNLTNEELAENMKIFSSKLLIQEESKK
ncbi:hypothetical protein CWI38_1670p0010 [Hamiltosporidium tvaerminnensis]|uniref:Uncharacterized protein n=1 Tax=Hamiltosporidium tvaerminnensis TaxID=1176355 RepID=A0A4Q9LR73_9MICR|nr:hypothetical protein CWI38_1670p0010 [Hamiltosporidium tvaerminnensis]